MGVAATLVAAFFLLTLYSCASIGTPSGGPRDEEPPRFVRSTPEPGATDFSGERITMEFDELISLRDAFTNVILSPPQRSAPKVTASGRKIIVQFTDTLMPNTTYNLDFGETIEDVNENNKLPGFSFAFSTGGTLDTLMMSGIVLDALTLEPQQGVLVGAYTDMADSAFLKVPFERVTRTDDRGRFTLRALRAVPYRVFALSDLNRDYHWDNPAELMAFLPAPVTPYTEQTTASDTIYNMLTGEPDSIVTRGRTRFLPNDLLLQMFDFGYKPQYITNYSRADSTRLNIIFNQRQDRAPELTLVQPASLPLPSHWYLTERNERNDTLCYWLTPQLYRTDTLKVALSYLSEQRDSEPKLITDTLSFVTQKPRKVKQPKLTEKQLKEDSIKREMERFILPVREGSSPINVNRDLTLLFPEPLTRLDTTSIRLERLSPDSTWIPVEMLAGSDEMIPRRIRLSVPWEYDTEYRLIVDSLAAEGISGRLSRTLSNTFKTKRREDYASLMLRLKPDTIAGFVEILNTSDNVVERATVIDGKATFYFLSPNDYYARFVADTNDNGRFDPGDYERGTQPEEVYYYPKLLSLKRYDRNEEWDLYATPVDMQKPDRIKKNKPKETSRGRSTSDTTDQTEEEDDYFDATRNPFDPNDKGRNRRKGSY